MSLVNQAQLATLKAKLGIATMERTLGPIDTGPPRRWRHIVPLAQWPIALCGHDCTKLSVAQSTSTSRMCPDCERLNGGNPL